MKAISNYTKMAFQMSQQICVNEGRTLVGTFFYASKLIYSWIKEKFPNMGMSEKLCSYSRSNSGISIDIIYNWDKQYFCMKTVHPDLSTAGRVWTTEAEITKLDGNLKFGVKNYYSTLDCVQVDYVDFSVPSFVWKIYNRVGIVDGGLNNGQLLVVDNDESYDIFRTALTNPKRTLPIIAIAQNNSTDTELVKYFETKEGYLLDGYKLTEDLKLVAHVAYISTEYSFKLSTDLGKQWSVYSGAVRTYYKGIVFESSDCMEHPLQIAGKIMSSSYVSREQREYIGGHAFRHILTHSLKRQLLNERYSWGDLGHKFYFIANKEIVAEKLSQMESDNDFDRSIYELQIDDLNKEIDTLNSLLASDDKEIEELQAQVNQLKQNKIFLDTQNYQLKQKLKEQKKEIAYPDTYDEMVEWVEENYKAQIYLHSRAIKGLKNAEFEDIKLVYQAVQLLGEHYYSKRMGYITEETYQKELKKLKLGDEKAITAISAGEQGQEYYITIGDKKHLLERHLTYGVSRDKRYCLRIYFYWDEDRNQVVIGDMPAHLNIRSSN